jgi:hypothetical protein
VQPGTGEFLRGDFQNLFSCCLGISLLRRVRAGGAVMVPETSPFVSSHKQNRRMPATTFQPVCLLLTYQPVRIFFHHHIARPDSALVRTVRAAFGVGHEMARNSQPTTV